MVILGVMKTAISMPDSLFEDAEQLAKQLGISRSELYATALRKFVREHDSGEILSALNAVYAEDTASVDPILSQLQASTSEEEDWE